MSAFTRANSDGKYDELIKGATTFLKQLQWDEAEGKEPSDPYFGGAGYGGHSRPDLSNTSFFVEALKEAGVKEDDPAMQKALVFISRCQNLESEHNTTEFASKIDDGGFYYTPAAGGTSQAGNEPNGGLRSYGSMTYAGLKSMIYAGLDKDDPRAKAAYDWARKHYTVSENPGLGEQGVFYYYQTLAKALDTLDVEQIEDADGKKHDWRADLTAELLRRQNENGSWVNSADRWYEGDPNLVTAYTLMALNRVQPPKK
jgi:squalene-hopene/tetraprenyl-beta-curcumene cyclase